MVDAGEGRDVAAGVPAILLGSAGLWLSRGYPFSTLTDMGPGFMPVIVSLLTVAVGIGIAVRRRDRAANGHLAWRAMIFVFAAMIAFGLSIERLGLVVATICTTIICAYATPEARWTEAISLGIGFAIFTVLVFVYGLGQPLPVWWWDR